MPSHPCSVSFSQNASVIAAGSAMRWRTKAEGHSFSRNLRALVRSSSCSSVKPISMLVFRPKQKLHPLVLAGLDPATHGPRHALCQLPWIPGTRPGMDDEGLLRVNYLIASER